MSITSVTIGSPVLAARLGEDLQAFFLHALKRVGGRARLEGAAAQEVRARRLDRHRRRIDLLAALDGARAGDDAEAPAAESAPPPIMTAVSSGFTSRDTSFHGLEIGTASATPLMTVKIPGSSGPWIAGDADRQPRRARHLVRREPELPNPRLDRRDLLAGGAPAFITISIRAY